MLPETVRYDLHDALHGENDEEHVFDFFLQVEKNKKVRNTMIYYIFSS